MFLHRLPDAPKNQLKTLALGSLIVAQAVTGTALAAHADTPSSNDSIVARATAEASSAEIPKTAGQVSAQQLLKLAVRQVGISENSAGGDTKFHRWYMNSPRAEETVARDGGSIAGFANASWCDMFVSWVGAQLGIEDTVGSDAYTVEHAKWFQADDRWGTTPKPGAVVFFSWSGSKNVEDIQHVGFVIKDNGDGSIKTVEGNTDGGKVEIRTRPTYQVAGYGYPSYAA
jgi:hypothetical protein